MAFKINRRFLKKTYASCSKKIKEGLQKIMEAIQTDIEEAKKILAKPKFRITAQIQKNTENDEIRGGEALATAEQFSSNPIGFVDKSGKVTYHSIIDWGSMPEEVVASYSPYEFDGGERFKNLYVVYERELAERMMKLPGTKFNPSVFHELDKIVQNGHGNA